MSDNINVVMKLLLNLWALSFWVFIGGMASLLIEDAIQYIKNQKAL